MKAWELWQGRRAITCIVHCSASLYRPQPPPPDAVLYDGGEQLAPRQHLISWQAGHLGQLPQHHGGSVLAAGQAGEEEEERHAHLGGEGGGEGGRGLQSLRSPHAEALVLPPPPCP